MVEVKRQTLTVGASVNGKIGYGTPTDLPIRASGTVTWLPRSGVNIARGGVLMRVDEKPVVLMYGSTPSYRALHDTATEIIDDAREPTGAFGGDHGSSEAADQQAPPVAPPPAPLVGSDVEELEENLSALGYRGFDVDEEFTSNTTEAIRAWQRDLGVPPTGRVELGDVLVVPGPIRLVTDPAALGGESPSTAVQQTSTEKVITATASSESLGWAEPGAKVRVTLPSQRTVVASVDSVVTGDEAESSVRLRFAHPERAPTSGTVTVSYIAQRARHVLTVPVTALVALAEGGYGIQLADSSGTFVPVVPGLYADGTVEISGDIEPGAKIRVPR